MYIDSPMAIDVTEIYARHPEEHNLDMTALEDKDRSPLRCTHQHFARTPEESKAINHLHGPARSSSSRPGAWRREGGCCTT